MRRTLRSRFLHLWIAPASDTRWILLAALALTPSFPAAAQQDSTNQAAPQTDTQPAGKSPTVPAAPPATVPGTAPAAAQQPTTEQPAAGQPTPSTAISPPTDNPLSPSPATSPADHAAIPEPVQYPEPSHLGVLHLMPSREINQDELKQLLVGKQLFLRGGYLENSLSFNENGALIGHSAQGSYTLNAIEIDKVHLSRHKVELEGKRYALHFLGALPSEDPASAFDRVNITPKKKIVKITLDREIVVKLKQPKEKKKSAKDASKEPPGLAETEPAVASATPDASQQSVPAAEPSGAASPAPTQPGDASAPPPEIAAAPPEEGPADPKSVTTTTSPAHANKVLLDALDNVFAQPFDARMMDAMPGFWRLYYDAATAKADYRPKDPTVLRQSMVDQKAKLVSTFEPPSNEYAQDNGVAGMALYHVVIGADGKPGEIAVARPIGFGLDENAVDSIGKATFSPAMKGGKPVPVLLDLVVQFRIYSKRTSEVSSSASADQDAPTLPGPYSVQRQHP